MDIKIKINTPYTMLRYFKKNPSKCDDGIIDDVFENYNKLEKYLKVNKINKNNIKIELKLCLNKEAQNG